MGRKRALSAVPSAGRGRGKVAPKVGAAAASAYASREEGEKTSAWPCRVRRRKETTKVYSPARVGRGRRSDQLLV